MKGWWKMVVCHLKHSYLNWRAIPCRKRIDCVYEIFIFNTFWIWSSWFSFGLNRISQVHDMTIKFLFLFFLSCFFFCCFHELFTPGDDACHRWPSKLKHHFSCEIILKRVVFWSKGCSYHFCQQERVMA